MEISVIIPLYNAENFIGTCLASLLAQTFQDFEVIVVDDCSTDNSLAIVENFAEKFGDRLIISRTKTNSGGGGYIPRNIGLGLSRGKYIYFLDADDFIVETALEILYGAAKNFDSDVIYSSSCYSFADMDNFSLIMDAAGRRARKNGIEDKPTIARDDSNENLKRLLISDGFFHMPWTKFVEKRLLIENEIEFPQIISGGDFIWTIQVLYFAKKLLRLPIPLYFYRENAINSVTRKKRAPKEQISTCFKAFLMGARTLQDLSEKIPPLKQNHDYFFAAVAQFYLNLMGRTSEARNQLGSSDIYKILAQEFNDDLILPFLFSIIDEQQKVLLSKNKIKE